jgi:hypothetical protein
MNNAYLLVLASRATFLCFHCLQLPQAYPFGPFETIIQFSPQIYCYMPADEHCCQRSRSLCVCNILYKLRRVFHEVVQTSKERLHNSHLHPPHLSHKHALTRKLRRHTPADVPTHFLLVIAASPQSRTRVLFKWQQQPRYPTIRHVDSHGSRLLSNSQAHSARRCSRASGSVPTPRKAVAAEAQRGQGASRPSGSQLCATQTFSYAENN